MSHNTRFGVESKTKHLFAIRFASLVVTCDRISLHENGRFSVESTFKVLATRKSDVRLTGTGRARPRP